MEGELGGWPSVCLTTTIHTKTKNTHTHTHTHTKEGARQDSNSRPQAQVRLPYQLTYRALYKFLDEFNVLLWYVCVADSRMEDVRK